MVPPPARYGLPGIFAARLKPNGCALPATVTVVAKAVRYALAALSEKLAHWQ